MALTRRTTRRLDIWPGFVDALASLLIIFVFVLLIFMIAQFILNEALSGRDEALDRLNQQVAELSDMLDLERQASANLRVSVAQLSDELQESVATRDRLTQRLDGIEAALAAAIAARDDLDSRLAATTAERDSLRTTLDITGAQRDTLKAELTAAARGRDEVQARLEEAVAERDALATRLAAKTEEAEAAAADAGKVRAELEDAYKVIEADKAKIETQLAELERLVTDLRILRSLRDELEAKLVAAEERASAAARAAEERAAEIEAGRRTLVAREAALGEANRIGEEARRQVELLNRQILSLREKLARIEAALATSEAANRDQKIEIASLGKRLNEALATKVAELARYRSEFFGRLREILGTRTEVRIVGDRFVFQSEVLFASSSADLGEAGKDQLRQLAETLGEIAARIPPDIDWVLRVDGHTDRRPIATARFPSNWELSTARALSVVHFLIENGMPPARLAATGFGEHQPLDAGDDAESYRRNRRIEFKLTQR